MCHPFLINWILIINPLLKGTGIWRAHSFQVTDSFFPFSQEVLFWSENGFARQGNQLVWEGSMSMEGVSPSTVQQGRAFHCMDNFLYLWHLLCHMVVVLRSMAGLDELKRPFLTLIIIYTDSSHLLHILLDSQPFWHLHVFILQFKSLIIIKIYSYLKKGFLNLFYASRHERNTLSLLRVPFI